MKSFKKSIHASENIWLRNFFVARRKELGLSQRGLADRLNVIYSTIGKIETGDRRLDVLEFMSYCEALELAPELVITELNKFIHQEGKEQ